MELCETCVGKYTTYMCHTCKHKLIYKSCLDVINEIVQNKMKNKIIFINKVYEKEVLNLIQLFLIKYKIQYYISNYIEDKDIIMICVEKGMLKWN